MKERKQMNTHSHIHTHSLSLSQNKVFMIPEILLQTMLSAENA